VVHLASVVFNPTKENCVNNTSRRSKLLIGFSALAILASACGSDKAAAPEAEPTVPVAESANEPPLTAVTGGVGELAGGEVFVTGSSTVEPISVLVAELADEQSGGKLAVTVEGPGTGDGFAKFCAGEADISDASRKIKDEEAALCAEAGIEFVELAVGIDGLTVATSNDNAAVECLDVPALYALLGPESEGFSKWSDAQALATELGSTATLPDAALTITGPGVESGTYDSLVEFVAKKIAGDRKKDVKFRSDYTQSANDNLIVEGVEASPTSLGWVGFSFYEVEKDRMKAIGIDNGDGCVVPTAETIADGSYPFSRTLFVYVSKKSLADNPGVKSYVDLYLSEAGLGKVVEAGYVALGADVIAATQDTWSAAG
jgi:phosphate transport system substrate-binding protein